MMRHEGMRRSDAVGDAACEWLDTALGEGMSTRDAAEVLKRVWIPRLVRAMFDDEDA